MDNRSLESIPADAFMEILQRVPTNPRRRLRLVCRHWRSAIDDRTPATQARDMVLAFVVGRGRPRAYVLDDLTKHGAGGRELELHRGVPDPGVMSMVGTCNGLLCLRPCRGPDDFLVVNPVTGERLAVPPWSPVLSSKQAADSFTYHPATGLYKIVHIPREGAVSVFTLGDRTWREVPMPVGIGTTHLSTSLGLASIDGVIYWVAADSHSVMSLDLKDEHVVFVAKLPVALGPMDRSCHLTTDLHGRLIFVGCSDEMNNGDKKLKMIQTKVWMLDNVGGNKARPAWVLRCKAVEPGLGQPHHIAWPHVIHGDHILTTWRSCGVNRESLHAYLLSEERTHGSVLRLKGSPSIGLYHDCHHIGTFAYVETTEPLAIYGFSDYDIGDSEDWEWRFDDRKGRWKLKRHNSSSVWYDDDNYC